ncbi:hypothetical protein ACEQ8H_008326 [Pleosporales sp. CAS-2024a]
MVDFSLTAEQEKLKANAQAFAQNVLSSAPKLYSRLPTQTERFQSTLAIYQNAVKLGLIKGQIPVPLGGTSGGLIDAAIVVEEFHAVEPSTAITILGTGLGLTPLILAGSKEHHAKFLTRFLEQEGEPIASFMHSEPGGTANWLEKGATGLQTTAFKDGDDWVVNGEKLWTTNSGGGDNRGANLACLVCREVSEPSEAQSPDIEPASKILILLLTRADISANDPSAYTVLSDPELFATSTGAQIVEHTFGMSAALVGAMCTGVMRHAFELALAFCKTDTRGGKGPIIQHQSVSDGLIDVKMKIEASRALVWKAMSVLESEHVAWEAKLELACEAKVWCSEQVVGAVETCMAVVGMKSYDEEMGFVKILNDVVCLPLFDGGNVGVRRRQIEKIMSADGYKPWGATYV